MRRLNEKQKCRGWEWKYLVDYVPCFRDKLILRVFRLFEHASIGLFVVNEPNVPAVKDTDWIFADKSDGHVGVSVLFNWGIVNGRKSAASFVTIEDGGLSWRFILGIGEAVDNDKVFKFVIGLSFRSFDEGLFDCELFIEVTKNSINKKLFQMHSRNNHIHKLMFKKKC